MIKINDKSIYVIMYHYVHPKKNNNYFPALELTEFKKQINYFQKIGRIIDNEEFINIINNKKFDSKPNFLLTFDDGYKDHYDYVYPYLKKRNITGNFYVPTSIWNKNKILDINKIHLILNKENNHKKLLNYIYNLLEKDVSKKFKSKKILDKVIRNKYDKIETLIIKRFLQYMLPENVRINLLDFLFNQLVNASEADLVKKTYLSVKEAQEMSKNHMHFGSHGETHRNFRLLDFNDQLSEVKNSVKFLKKNKIIKKEISLCYPWGEFNKFSKKLFENISIQYGITVLPGHISENSKYSKYYLPRYDTNYFL
jgi:peptidoglycan/xylan/chitin deacetylase (PgdA/CDA1 family)